MVGLILLEKLKTERVDDVCDGFSDEKCVTSDLYRRADCFAANPCLREDLSMNQKHLLMHQGRNVHVELILLRRNKLGIAGSQY